MASSSRCFPRYTLVEFSDGRIRSLRSNDVPVMPIDPHFALFGDYPSKCPANCQIERHRHVASTAHRALRAEKARAANSHRTYDLMRHARLLAGYKSALHDLSRSQVEYAALCCNKKKGAIDAPPCPCVK